jgi:hypothetical protein
MECFVRRFEMLPSGTAESPERRIGVAMLVLAAMLDTPAVAQDNASGVEQIGSPAAQPVYSPQLAPAGPAIDLPQRGARESAPPTQLSASEESTPATPQLTREAESARSAPQLYRGGRTAQPSTPLSSPGEGRTAAVTRVQGEDRCDPRAPRGESPACERVIETRAAEFVRPAPTRLSPEQRLLGEQRMMPAASAQAAAQRLATNAANPNSLEDQSIASVVLGSTQAPVSARPTETEPAEGDAAAIEAIVNAVVNPTPQF